MLVGTILGAHAASFLLACADTWVETDVDCVVTVVELSAASTTAFEAARLTSPERAELTWLDIVELMGHAEMVEITLLVSVAIAVD